MAGMCVYRLAADFTAAEQQPMSTVTDSTAQLAGYLRDGIAK